VDLVEASPVEEEQEEDGKMEEIKKVLGENLISVIKYTVGTEEKFLFIVNELSIKILEQIKPHFTKDYLFLTQKELKDGLDVFPLEFLNIKNNYELIHGKDTMANLEFDNNNIRRELEFEFRSKLIYLREQYLASTSKAEQKELILSALPTLAPILTGLLLLKNAKKPGSLDEVFDLIKQEYDENMAIFKKIEKLKNKEIKFKTDEIKEYINGLIVVLTNLSEKLDKFKI